MRYVARRAAGSVTAVADAEVTVATFLLGKRVEDGGGILMFDAKRFAGGEIASQLLVVIFFDLE